ncbi:MULTISPECIES: ATP-grasp domain-containing protein [unclassified Clostridium]|uniref:ATP-grasp domain-containing protein n=1 Tax=unclassified Clostridium TaxID=2614128 RepID=UPI001D93DCDC|nr:MULTISPECIES: ATP-grasp domain-containing protein [unclassified Clostridium]MBN1044488.1 ATP-grasp domain-containing protein [Clostridium botulinum]
MLITSIGKRIQLIKHLKESFTIIGVDASELNAGKYFVDKFYKIPKINEKNYVGTIINICKNEKIDVLIPLYEGEFEILDNLRKIFKSIETLLLLSNKDIINVCKDKEKTYSYFINSSINNIRVFSEKEVENIIEKKDINKLPLIIKPKCGMGSKDIYKINTIKELIFFNEYVQEKIVQEFILGDEYTVDVLVDLEGEPIYIVPRKRIEVRSGEVVKSATIKDCEIINITKEVLKQLNRLKDENNLGLIGPLTIQFFKKENGEILLLEINPRFGGGVPLSFESGANYGKQISKMLTKEKVDYIENFIEKTMIRYEDAIYI